MSRIGIVGHYGGNNDFYDGQTVRTKIMTEEIINHFTKKKIYCVDTYNYRKRALQVIISTIICVITCKDIIIILSRNGCKVFYPFLYLCSKLFGRKVYNNLVGGGNNELFSSNPKHIKYCNAFRVNWVQLDEQKRELENIGLRNVEELPNTKRLEIANKDQLNTSVDLPLRFCTFSRVSKSKGIELAANIIMEINKEAGRTLVELDIYGKPDDDYKEEFERFQENFTSAVRYCGTVPFNKSTEVLRHYFALLFPTTFYGEGFPGTVIDAFSAGVPVIASSWHYNSKVVNHGKTGWIYDYKDRAQLKAYILLATRDPDRLVNMKAQCIERAYRYTPEKVMPIIYKYFE